MTADINLFKSFIALPFFIIIPIFLGRIFFKRSLILSWSLGYLIIYLIYFGFHFLNIYKIGFTVIFILLLLIVSVITSIKKHRTKFKVETYNILWLPIFFGLFTALLISIVAPYPYIHDVDAFTHTQFINLILSGKYLDIQTAYLPGFHVLIAALSILFNFSNNVYDFFWISRFLTFPLYAVGIYLVLKEIIKDKNIALLGSFLAPLLTIEYLSLTNFAPKIVSLIILPYFLYLIYNNKKLSLFAVVVIIITSLSIHYLMGLVNLLVIFSILFFRKIYYPKIILLLLLMTFIPIILQFLQIIDLSGESIDFIGAVDLRSYNFKFNGERFLEYFPVIILTLAILGILSRRNDKNIIIILPALFVIISCYFLPFNASFRILASIIPLIVLLLSVFILDFYNLISSIYGKKVSFIILIPLLILVFIKPYYVKINKWITYPENRGYFTIVTPAEFQAAQWIRENIHRDVYILSDPVNSVALSALTKNNSLLDVLETMKLMNKKKPDKAYNYLKRIEEEYQKKFIIFVDGRTSFWVRNKNDQEIFYAPNIAKKFRRFKGYKKFLNDQYFQTIYQKDGVYLFQLL